MYIIRKSEKIKNLPYVVLHFFIRIFLLQKSDTITQTFSSTVLKCMYSPREPI